MEKRPAKAIHLICRKSLNVKDLGHEFLSGNWALSKKDLIPGIKIALHEKAAERSYYQGTLVRIETALSPDKPRAHTRYVLRVKKSNKALEWQGKRAYWRSIVRD
jgi:hypothetical protein